MSFYGLAIPAFPDMTKAHDGETDSEHLKCHHTIRKLALKSNEGQEGRETNKQTKIK